MSKTQKKPQRSKIEEQRTLSFRIKQRAKDLGGGILKAALKDPLAIFLLLAAIGLFITFFKLVGSIAPAAPGVQVSLSDVNALAKQKKIASTTYLDYDARLVLIKRKSGETVWSAMPKQGANVGSLLEALQKQGSTIEVDQQSNKSIHVLLVQFLVPILLLVTLFMFFMRLGNDEGGGGIAAFSKFAGGRKKKGSQGGITFDDVAGNPEALAELKEIRDFLADPSKYSDLGASAPKGVLLVGPPGTGKTLLARAVAGEADANFFTMSGSEFVESLVGVGAARVRDLFRQARKAAPAIIFIDELDAAGRKRGAGVGQGNDEREQTLNQMLVEMDGFGGDAGIVVMGATNRPDILDPALLRPGRFDRQVTVDVPDVYGRAEILGLYVKNKPLAADVDIKEVAKLCPGFSGAELANVVNEAALLTVREGRVEIDQATFEEGIERVVAGPAKKTHILSKQERWVIAIHEAAHAVVAKSIGQATSMQKVSIIARGRSLGTAAHMLSDRDQVIRQKSDLQRELVAVMAGATAEEIEFGGYSTAVHDDLHAATGLARSMVTNFGMSDELGPMTVGDKMGEVFLGAQMQELGSVGPATLDLIDREVEATMREASRLARLVLETNWTAVLEAADALIEHESLSGLALEAVLATTKPVQVGPARNRGDEDQGSDRPYSGAHPSD